MYQTICVRHFKYLQLSKFVHFSNECYFAIPICNSIPNIRFCTGFRAPSTWFRHAADTDLKYWRTIFPSELNRKYLFAMSTWEECQGKLNLWFWMEMRWSSEEKKIVRNEKAGKNDVKFIEIERYSKDGCILFLCKEEQKKNQLLLWLNSISIYFNKIIIINHYLIYWYLLRVARARSTPAW